MPRFAISALAVAVLGGCSRGDVCPNSIIATPMPSDWASWPVVDEAGSAQSRPDGTGPHSQKVTLYVVSLRGKYGMAARELQVQQRFFDGVPDSDPYVEISQPNCVGEKLRYSVRPAAFKLRSNRSLALRQEHDSSYVLSEIDLGGGKDKNVPLGAVAAFELGHNWSGR